MSIQLRRGVAADADECGRICLDLRRVDITQPPFHAVLPSGIAVDKAGRAASPASTDRDSASALLNWHCGGFSALRRSAEPVEDEGQGKGACKASEARHDEGDQKSAAWWLSVFGGVPGEVGDGVGLRVPGAFGPLECWPIGRSDHGRVARRVALVCLLGPIADSLMLRTVLLCVGLR